MLAFLFVKKGIKQKDFECVREMLKELNYIDENV